MSGWRALRVLAATAVLVVAGCSSGDDVPDDQVIVPASAPSDWVEATFDGGFLSTPGGWEESVTEASENDATVYNWQTPVNEHGTRGGLQVTVIESPTEDAEQAARSVVTSYQAIMEISDEETTEVTWPGADEAWFVSLTADVPNDDGDAAPHPAQFLIVDRADGTQVSASVTELADEFAGLELATVLATLTLE